MGLSIPTNIITTQLSIQSYGIVFNEILSCIDKFSKEDIISLLNNFCTINKSELQSALVSVRAANTLQESNTMSEVLSSFMKIVNTIDQTLQDLKPGRVDMDVYRRLARRLQQLTLGETPSASNLSALFDKAESVKNVTSLTRQLHTIQQCLLLLIDNNHITDVSNEYIQRYIQLREKYTQLRQGRYTISGFNKLHDRIKRHSAQDTNNSIESSDHAAGFDRERLLGDDGIAYLREQIESFLPETLFHIGVEGNGYGYGNLLDNNGDHIDTFQRTDCPSLGSQNITICPMSIDNDPHNAKQCVAIGYVDYQISYKGRVAPKTTFFYCSLEDFQSLSQKNIEKLSNIISQQFPVFSEGINNRYNNNQSDNLPHKDNTTLRDVQKKSTHVANSPCLRKIQFTSGSGTKQPDIEQFNRRIESDGPEDTQDLLQLFMQITAGQQEKRKGQLVESKKGIQGAAMVPLTIVIKTDGEAVFGKEITCDDKGKLYFE